jgi:hypothetical protein
MPSSLVVGALVVAWLVVLVPMVSRRRKEVVHTGDAVLAARVVHSGAGATGLVSRARSGARREAHTMPRREDGQPVQQAGIQQETTELPLPADDDLREADMPVETPPEREVSRAYRPGRGGYDEQGAALAASAKYATRRRAVTGLVVAAAVLAVLAALGPAGLWWLQLVADIALVGYLGYLRRQVRIEEDVRRRRAARLHPTDDEEGRDEEDPDEFPAQPSARPFTDDVPPPAIHPGARMVGVDDDDPAFDDLADDAIPPYRPAVGE